MANKAMVEYANMAAVKVVESAPNTLTFKKLDTQVSITDKVAWLINRIQLVVDINATQWNANLDSFKIALVRSNLLLDITDQTDAAVLWGMFAQRTDIGTAATSWLLIEPFVFDFSTFPGGGILTPPTPLWGAVQGTSCTAAITAQLRIHYQPIQLQDSEFWQLVESVRIISS